jgi:hypothetical protein
MRLLYLAWRHGGHDPYRLYNMLDEDYRPLGKPDAEPLPPHAPRRLRNVVYAFALVTHQEEAERMLASVPRA